MNTKRNYILLFAAIVAPAVLVRATGPAISDEVAKVLTIVSKGALIALTIWYGSKSGFSRYWALVLGFSTLLPGMAWISLLMLCLRKPRSASVINQEITLPRLTDEPRPTSSGIVIGVSRRGALVFVALACVFVFCGLFGWFVWPTKYRYDRLRIEGSELPVRIHRVTGEADYLSPIGDGWIKNEKPTAVTAPPAAVDLGKLTPYQLTGKAGIFLDDISVDLYNSTAHTVQQITVQIEVKNLDGNVAIFRQYNLTGQCPPLTSSTFRGRLGFTPASNQKWSWTIVNARGHKSKQTEQEEAAAFVDNEFK